MYKILCFWLQQRMMEKTSHINIAMIEDIGTNGMAVSKVGTGMDGTKQRCGSTVSFHNIQYKVQQQSGFLCKRKILSKEILVDLKSVSLSFSALSPSPSLSSVFSSLTHYAHMNLQILTCRAMICSLDKCSRKPVKHLIPVFLKLFPLCLS